MRNRRAFWKYYKDVTIFNLVFSIIFGIISNYFWGLISFCSLGIIIGLLGFQYFKKQEYYLYLNLGYTKLSLIKNTFVLNSIITISMSILISI